MAFDHSKPAVSNQPLSDSLISMPPLFETAITNKLLITAAYKYVALAVMLANCNLFVQETYLPLDHPITQTNIILSRCSVSPPRLMGFGGSIVTEKYFFGFGHGHLANFWQWEFRSASSSQGIRQQQEQWSKMTSQVGQMKSVNLSSTG